VSGTRSAAVKGLGIAAWQGMALCCLAAVWGHGKGVAIATAAPGATVSATTKSNPDTTPATSGPMVFPPLVPEGEPESILGVKWEKGVPTFENAPLAGSPMNSVAWSPDGAQLATASKSGVQVWDAVTGKELRRLDRHSASVNSVAWSPDSRFLASASLDRTVRLWDAATGNELRRLDGHAGSVNSVAWSLGSRFLASASLDRTVRLWDAATGKELLRLYGHAGSVNSVAWSPHNRFLASASLDRTVRLWDAATGKELLRLYGHSDSVNSVAWSPDGKILASASRDGTVRTWDVAIGKELRRLQGRFASVDSVAWSPDGKSLASASDDSTVRLWDAATGTELRGLEEHSDGVHSVAWSPDGKSLVSASSDGTIRLWDSVAGKELRRLQGRSSSVNSVAWSPDRKRLVSASDDETVRLWDSATGKELRRLDGHSSSVHSVAWSPDGKSLASAGDNRTVCLWDAATGKEMQRFDVHSSSIHSVAWSPDGKSLASAGLDDTVRIWDTASGKELRPLEGHSSSVNSVAWSPDGKSLASASLNGTIRLWNALSGKMLWPLDGHSDSVNWVAWSPDGKRLASASADKTIRLWDAATGKGLRRLAGHSSAVLSVAWSPDGGRLASASADKTIRLWDAATGKGLRRLAGHSSSVSSVAWSPDGKSLASGSHDGTIRLWDLQGSKASPAAVSWASGDGWISWRADARPDQRIVRGENGALLNNVGTNRLLESVPPASGLHPQLAASASVAMPAGQGEFGKIAVTITNAKDGTEAFWLELLPPKTKPLPDQIAFCLPSTTLRLDPGQSTNVHVGYLRHLTDDPAPGSARAVLELHHAHDGGKAIEVPVDLDLRSAQIATAVFTPRRIGDDLNVAVLLVNNGDQVTGRSLAISARFALPDGRSIASDFKTVYENGLNPGSVEAFALKVPKEVEKAPKFEVDITATEGIAAGIPVDSKEIGFVATWTSRAQWRSRLRPWPTYLALALGFLLLLGAVFFFRVYRDPIVVQTATTPSSLLKQPLRNLPSASRALARARRLEGTLATLGISDEQWQRALAVAASPSSSVSSLIDLFGARLVSNIDAQTARIELPPLHLRFGPHVALAVLHGPRVEPGQAQRLAETLREGGVTSALLVDLTQAENAREAFADIARFAPVVISSNTLRDLLLAKHPLRALETAVAKQRPLRELSPYRTAGGVEDAAMFFGRSKELRDLADRDLQNAVLVGARQMGKSSLLKALRARLETRGDVEARYVVLSGADLMGPIAQTLGRSTPNNIQNLQALVRGTKQKPVVWLIDEADEFAKADLAQVSPRPAPLCWAMRAVAEEGTAYFVLAGFWGLFRAAVFDTNSPLRNFGELMRLGPLDPDAARDLVTQPMQSLDVTVEKAVVDGILAQTGCRANLLVLACQGLVERLSAEQRAVTMTDLEAVWDGHHPLRDALVYWKAEPLDRAVGHAAFSLDRPTRKQIEERLTAAEIRLTATDLDLSLERLELGYVLLREVDRKGGPDRYGCVVPLIPYFESRIMPWDEHLERDAEELRHIT
jgi:WD40 repeat protein